MRSAVVSQTLQEHERLINLIDDLVAALKNLPNDVQWGSDRWLPDSEILDFVRVQTLSLEHAKESAVQGYYRDAYNSIRMVFESYFLLRLISTCDKFRQRVNLQSRKTGQKIDKNKLIEQIKRKYGEDLVNVKEETNYLGVVLRGRRVINDQGHATEKLLPFYYGAWQQYRPTEYYLKKESTQKALSIKRFLKAEWSSIRKSNMGAPDKIQGILHKDFFTFAKILENLRLNDVLSRKTTARVLVHYNFLSGFSHSTSQSINAMSKIKGYYHIGGDGIEISYSHYHSELALLYICHLLSMHLQHALYYLTKWCSIQVRKERKLYRRLCYKVQQDLGYFWFIFNTPHQYDRYEHANRKSNFQEERIFRPEDIRLGDVRYYDDPLYRLKQLHQSQRELTTGNIYDSPFPREDAL